MSTDWVKTSSHGSPDPLPEPSHKRLLSDPGSKSPSIHASGGSTKGSISKSNGSNSSSLPSSSHWMRGWVANIQFPMKLTGNCHGLLMDLLSSVLVPKQNASAIAPVSVAQMKSRYSLIPRPPVNPESAFAVTEPVASGESLRPFWSARSVLHSLLSDS